MADPFYDQGYPALHNAANEASLTGQRQFLNALRWRLGGLLVAAAAGALVLGTSVSILGAWAIVVGFALALCAELFTSIVKPDRQWYEGRAVAESAKTLAWRYAVKGESFELELTPAEADARFVARIQDVLHDIGDLELGAEDGEAQLTPELQLARDSGFEERRRLYRSGRLDDQRQWYKDKSAWNRRRWRSWLMVSLCGQVLGLVLGGLMIGGQLTVDLVGLVAAIVASATGWSQAKQYSTLSTAYSVTAQELAAVLSEVDRVDEANWATFVGQAEEAISREHTLWRASRGVRFQG